MPRKNETKYNKKIMKLITQKYLKGASTKELLTEFKMSTRTLYRILGRNKINPIKKKPIPKSLFFNEPIIAPLKYYKDINKKYPTDTPASLRQSWAFFAITKIDIREN